MRVFFPSKLSIYLVTLIGVVIMLHNVIVLHRILWRVPIKDKVFKDDTELEDSTEHKYKYILFWTIPTTLPFRYIEEGQNGFISRNCHHINCIVTTNRSLLIDSRLFDVIAFNGPDLSFSDVLISRSWHQRFVFANIESPVNSPFCTNTFDNFFNWTWTYKLDSEVRWTYFVIKNSKGDTIGPNKDMHWINWNDMRQVSEKMKQQLKSKTKAVAWFVSDCKTKSNRESIADSLIWYLRKYDLTVDIFGKCSNITCPSVIEDECDGILKKDYYFYLSFEKAFSEDYVTEQLLIPLQNNAIPIVYGGADYARFLPPGSYLNAEKLGVKQLAEQINTLINDPEKYATYFKWKNHYSYHKTSESVETNEYCNMCAILNDKNMMTQTSTKYNFYDWWYKQSCEKYFSIFY